MAQSGKNKPEKPKVGKGRVLWEEQGELLGEALNEVLLWDLVDAEDEEEEVDPELSEGEPASGSSEEEPGEEAEEEPEEEEREEVEEWPPEEEAAEELEEEFEEEPEEEAEAGPEEEAEAGPEEGAEEEVAASASAIPDSPWEQKMAWAKKRVGEGRKLEALELYRELVSEEPSSIRALNNLGILLDGMGEHEEAASHLTLAAELDPDNPEVLGNLGTVLGALGRYPEGCELLRRVLRVEPSNAEVRGNLGVLLFRRGLYEQAEVELASVCMDRPDSGIAHYYWGEALRRLGRVDAAIDALQRAIEVMPESSRAFHSLGILFDQKNLPEEASAMYRKSKGSGTP